MASNPPFVNLSCNKENKVVPNTLSCFLLVRGLTNMVNLTRLSDSLFVSLFRVAKTDISTSYHTTVPISCNL